MIIPGHDGLYDRSMYPESVPELAGPPPAKKRGFTWTPPVDAMDRETYLRVGRPLLLAAGFLTPVEAEKVPLPPMANTPRKRRVAKPKDHVREVAKKVEPPEEKVPF
jgi:hypothetical protein